FWKARGMLAECALCRGHEAEAFALLDECVDQLAAAGLSGERDEASAWRGELHLWLGRYGAALADLGPGMASASPYALIWGGAARGFHGAAGAHPGVLRVEDGNAGRRRSARRSRRAAEDARGGAGAATERTVPRGAVDEAELARQPCGAGVSDDMARRTAAI